MKDKGILSWPRRHGRTCHYSELARAIALAFAKDVKENSEEVSSATHKDNTHTPDSTRIKD